jgi:two-component sensor histidine kinase
MPTLEELAQDQTDLGPRDVDRLHELLGSWQLLADLSFADLLLWCRLSREEGFVCVAQMRPYTAQTLHPEDVFGTVVRPEELPVIDRAFAEGKVWTRDDPVLIDGVSVRMEGIPLQGEKGPIAVITKEGAPLTHRRPGQLEQSYLACAGALSRMVEQGRFPFPGKSLSAEGAPRVGDGLLRLALDRTVLYASPNAISAFRRLGIIGVIEGQTLDSLGVDTAPFLDSLDLGIPTEGEIEAGSTVVAQRAIPFVEDGKAVGAMMLVRDVTELRHRERMLRRKETVIQEIHHRVKNNLQTIASLLRVQARRSGSAEARGQLEEAVRRIASIAVVHETLSREPSEQVEFSEVAAQIIKLVSEGSPEPRAIHISLDGDPGHLPAELATPLAVVLIELLHNAVEHAFGGSGGSVQVTASRYEGKLLVVVADDGEGLPDGGEVIGGLGLQIVRALVEDELAGKLMLESDGGTKVSVEVPVTRKATRGTSSA